MHILEDTLNALAHADMSNEKQITKMRNALNFLASHIHNYNLPDPDYNDFGELYPENDDAKFIDACRKSLSSKF